MWQMGKALKVKRDLLALFISRLGMELTLENTANVTLHLWRVSTAV